MCNLEKLWGVVRWGAVGCGGVGDLAASTHSAFRPPALGCSSPQGRAPTAQPPLHLGRKPSPAATLWGRSLELPLWVAQPGWHPLPTGV